MLLSFSFAILLNSSSASESITKSFAGGAVCKNNAGANVTATGDDHRRHFFNTGGEIRFSTAGTNGSGEQRLMTV